MRQINRQGSIGGAVGFAKNNRVLVVEQGYPLDFYDIQTGKRIARVDRRQYMARMVGEELAVAGEDGTISLLEAATGKSISQTPGVGAMAASPDGKWLVVGKQDGSLDLLDLATHTVIKTFPVP
ncbi:MAG: hypothetical protein KF760_21390 [Candidatus Eremiobacteraeota bacterium]|nr:hypothetical protein [Candidatus Eremiobacteraeota bacterium]MCW5867557.1 hypothetical protein [Candidatus Eremiobacteraeota bacterium]